MSYLRACIEIDLSALRANLQVIRSQVMPARVLAILKANAYGHGLVRIAKALQEADGLGVACVEEALQLRQAGCLQKIVVLEGCLSAEECQISAQQQLDIVLHHHHQLQWLIQQPLARTITVWLKVNTGMNRLGFPVSEVAQVWRMLHACPGVESIVLMSHLDSADLPELHPTRRQQDHFQAAIQQLVGDSGGVTQCSLANSAALLAWPETHYDWVRPGLALYGVSPFAQTTAASYGLQPVMSLHSRLIAVRMLQAGETLGYHQTWRCREAIRMGVVAFGYGDGYPYHVVSGTPVLVNGQRARLIGRVSMDMLTVDLNTHPDAKIGDPVVLWGKGLPIESVSQQAKRFAYELLCGVQRDIKGRLQVQEVN